MYIAFILLVLVSGLWLYFNRAALSDSEVTQLAKQRRIRYLNRLTSFQKIELVANREFKKRMPANGKLINMDENTKDFPNIAAALLKYKKHEWIIFAFCKNSKVVSAWFNKGDCAYYVYSLLSPEDIVHICKQLECNIVLSFHNHPNPDPGMLDCTQASQQDFKVAQVYIDYFLPRNIGLVEFVCERGFHYEYAKCIPEACIELNTFKNKIISQNGKTIFHNWELHLQLLLNLGPAS
jgi:hypothetical protein